VFVSQLAFDPEPQRCAVADGQEFIVERPCHHRLRMARVDHVDAFIIRPAAQRIGTVKHQIARRVPDLHAVEQITKVDTAPFADGAPSLDAIMPGDLRLAGHRADLAECKAGGLFDQPVDRQRPVGKTGRSLCHIFRIGW